MFLRNDLELFDTGTAEFVSIKKLTETTLKTFRAQPVLEHIQSERALVVQQSSESLRVIRDVTESSTENHWSGVRFLFHPLLKNIAQFFPNLIAMLMAHVLPGSELSESFGKPLIAIRFPSDRLTPPLVRDFVS